jgi:predicted nucleic-acid-binding Zn-ribbon protein
MKNNPYTEKEKDIMDCEKCGGIMFTEKGLIFPTNPPKKKYCCKDCGNYEYRYIEIKRWK